MAHCHVPGEGGAAGLRDVLFPLTPTLSLGERENRQPRGNPLAGRDFISKRRGGLSWGRTIEGRHEHCLRHLGRFPWANTRLAVARAHFVPVNSQVARTMARKPRISDTRRWRSRSRRPRSVSFAGGSDRRGRFAGIGPSLARWTGWIIVRGEILVTVFWSQGTYVFSLSQLDTCA